MDENHASTDVLKRRLRDIAWGWVQVHWWKLLLALLSFIAGGVAAYVAIYIQLADAHYAAETAKAATDRLTESISQLVTKDQLDAAKDRISELERRLDIAEAESHRAPRPAPGRRWVKPRSRRTG